MFWKFHLDTSGIDTLLAKEDVTLKEILDEEDVLQECKTQNTKLLNFLVQENIIRQLLHYIVDPPDESVDDSVRYKYSNLACEVITLDIDSILEEIASKKECLDIIWSFIETPPPLNPLTASFFSKVITVLICRKSEETFSYLKSQDAVNKLIVHIEISAIMELFVKMLTAVETPNLRLEISRWMNKSRLIEKLIELLHSSQTQEVHYNSSQLLGELVRIGRDSISQDVGMEEDPLLLTLEKKDTTEKLFSVMFTEMEGTNSDSALVNGISIIMSLLEIKRPIIEGAEELITEMDIERIAQGIQPTLDVLSGKFQQFQKLLVQPKKTTTMETTFGTLDPPLGKLRITIASLVATAVSTNTKLLNEALANTEIIKTLLVLFIQYEWNNFLHSQVQRCISAILSSEIIPRCCDNKTSDSEDKRSCDREVKENQLTQENNLLLQHLFKDCQIVQKCLTMWENNELSEKSRKPRKGYMGHLTRIINDLIKAKANGPNEDAITSLYNELEEEVRQKWFELVKKVEETNKKNVCIPVNELPNLSVSDDELPAISKQYAGSLQQAFENYQVQLMTNEFIESFGYDENIDDGEHLRNHFSAVGNVDFSINANEMSDNEKLFNKVCDHKIRPYADLDGGGDEEDVWEERQLTFVSAAVPRESNSAISSDSDSSEDEENSGNKENNEDKKQQTGEKETEEEMDVDPEWTANFDSFGMETQQQEADDWASKFTENTNVSMSTSGEDFANFTDISKFEISDNDSTNPPVAMETEGSKVSGSAYEVTMESEEESTTAEKSETVERNTRGSEYVIIEDNKRPGTVDESKEIQKGLSENVQPINTSIESTHSHVTSITVKSIRVNKKDQPNESADPGSAEDVNHTPQVHTHGSGTPVRKTTPESVKQLVKTPAIESSESMEKSEEGISNISERKFTENSHQGVSESGSITVNGPSTVVNELTGNLQT